jgi:hypothetical protein
MKILQLPILKTFVDGKFSDIYNEILIEFMSYK